MPNEVVLTSSQLTTPWVIDDAQREANGDVNVQRMAMAVSASLTLWYGDRLIALTQDIEADSNMLRTMNTALTDWTSADWIDGKARSLLLTEWGVTGQDYDQADVRGTYASVLEAGLTGAAWPPEGIISQSSDGSYFAYEGLGIVQKLMQPGVLYSVPKDPYNRYPDDADFAGQDVYFFDGIRLYTVPPENIQKFTTVAPSQAELDDWKDTVQIAAESKSQASLGKQVFMQELLQRKGMFQDWCTNLMKLDEAKDNIVRNF